MQCPFCGYENPNESNWCGKCGKSMSVPKVPSKEIQSTHKKTIKFILTLAAVAVIFMAIITLQNPQWFFNETEKAAVMAINELKNEVPELEDIQLEEGFYLPSDKDDGGTFYFNYEAQVNGENKRFCASVFYYSNERGKYCHFWHNNDGYADWFYYTTHSIEKLNDEKIQRAIR